MDKQGKSGVLKRISSNLVYFYVFPYLGSVTGKSIAFRAI